MDGYIIQQIQLMPLKNLSIGVDDVAYLSEAQW